MAGATTRGIPYPEGPDDFSAFAADLQAIAEGADTALDDLETALTGTLLPRGAKALQGSAQSIADSTATAVELTSESWDTDGFHDNATNPSRFTVPTGLGGWYVLVGQVGYGANATGQRQARWHLNGSALLTGIALVLAAPIGDPTIVQSVVEVQLADGDYVELCAFQRSGGPLDTAPTTTSASIRRVGDTP